MTYCRAPFVSKKVGLKNGVCCRFPFNGDMTQEELNEMRLNFLENKTGGNEVCENCNLKMEYNEVPDFYYVRNLKNMNKDGSIDNYRPYRIEVFLERTCNCSCATCNSNVSSSHWVPTNDDFLFTLEDREEALKEFEREIKRTSLRHVNISYGEVTAFNNFDKIYDILKRNQDHLNIVTVTTNGTNYEKMKKLGELEKVHPSISIDAIEKEKALFIRSDWNIENLRKIDFTFSVNTVMSILNVWDIDEILKEIDDQETLHGNFIDPMYGPRELSIFHMDRKEKEKIIDFLESINDSRLEYSINEIKKNMDKEFINPIPKLEEIEKGNNISYNVLNDNLLDYIKRIRE